MDLCWSFQLREDLFAIGLILVLHLVCRFAGLLHSRKYDYNSYYTPFGLDTNRSLDQRELECVHLQGAVG